MVNLVIEDSSQWLPVWKLLLTSEAPSANIIRLIMGTCSLIRTFVNLQFKILIIQCIQYYSWNPSYYNHLLWFNYVWFEMIGQVTYGFPIVLLMFYYWFSTYLSITVRGIRELCYQEHRWISPTQQSCFISYLGEQHILFSFQHFGIFPCSLYVCVLRHLSLLYQLLTQLQPDTQWRLI